MRTVNGFTIIKEYCEAIIFNIKTRLYVIENLEVNILLGVNFVRFARIILYFAKKTLQCGQHSEAFLNFTILKAMEKVTLKMKKI